jgi:hypothetical protein
MLTPYPITKTAVINAAATAAQTLPEAAVLVISAEQASTAAYGVGTALTPVTGAPAAGQIQFTGTPQAPATGLTLNAAATVDQILTVTYVPVGGICGAS